MRAICLWCIVGKSCNMQGFQIALPINHTGEMFNKQSNNELQRSNHKNTINN